MIAALAALVCLLFVALVILITWILVSRKPQPIPARLIPKTEGQVLAEQADGALPLHPTDPPRYVNYQPLPGRPPVFCACHPEKPLTPGERVLWWPLPEPEGAVRIICEETLKKEGAVRERG